jgi:outer membrane receptor protein involved in Fe transport
VVSRTDLQSSGYTDLAQALEDLPGVGTNDSNIGQPGGSTQNAGTSNINLRNLGANRTLVLIDGHRTVSNAANRNVVSLNTIPTDFVDRVDIITGAASAIYGSDAIAGVVNIITESKLEGLRLRIRGGTSLGASGNDEVTGAATFGHKFAGGRGYLLLGVNYEENFGLMASDRLARAGRSWTFNRLTNRVTEPDLSTDISGGRFRGTNFYYDATGLRTGFVTAVNGYNDRLLDTLVTPRKAMSYAGKLNFEVSPAFKPFVQVQFSDLDTYYSRAPIGIRDTTQSTPRDPATGLAVPGTPIFTVGRIPLSNPYIPAAIRSGAPSSGIDFRRRFDEVGNREIINDRDTLRIFAGFNGKILGDWFYEVSYSYGDFKQHQLRTNGVNLLNLQNALRAVTGPGGTIQCADAAARAAGCVPINLFGMGSITPAAAAYIRANSVFESHLTQQVAQAYMTGNLFDLPAGPVSVAFGGEYRREHGSLETDDATRSGYTTNTGIPGFDNGFDVKEGFVEATIPIFKDQPFFHALSLDLAGRLASYSQDRVNTVYSYRAGLTWAPVEDFRFRASFGTAQRAPDLAELYSPPRDDTGSAIDICAGVRATTSGTVAANCRREPGIAAAIAADGVFAQPDNSVSSPNGGNTNLKQETAQTLTIGSVFAPRMLPNLNLSLDYYHIKVKDAIDAYGEDLILRQCYSAANYPDNRFCGLITRNAQDGQIQQIIQLQENLNSIVVSGLDMHFSYASKLDRIGLPGRIDLRADWNHVFKNQTTFVGLSGLEIEDNNGEINTPKDVVVGRIGYSIGPANLQWRTRYYGPTVSSNQNVAVVQAAGIVDPLYLRYDAYWRHDIYASIDPDLPGLKVQLYAGIRNLLNDAGPAVPEGATGNTDDGYISTYGVVGRTFYAGLSLKF